MMRRFDPCAISQAEAYYTGINDAKATAGKAGDSYNLNGSRVTQPKKGIYVVNGKKVVLK